MSLFTLNSSADGGVLVWLNLQNMAKVEIKYTKHFIDNEWVDSVSGKTFPTLNPQNESVNAQVAEGDKADIDKAVAAAKKAFHRNSEWRTMDASQRGKLLLKFADLIEREAKYLADLETLDNGKPISSSMFEVKGTADIVRYFAGLADKVHGKTIPGDGQVMSMSVKEPVGVCGAIIPWNFPMIMFALKAAPALAAGCVVIIKPAEQTPLTALALAALAKEAGFPNGVLNVVNGFGTTAGAAIVNHPDVDKVAFTGSTETGKLILSQSSAANLKRVTLELGGKSALTIFDDADLDYAANIATTGVFFNAGQICVAPSRTFVQAGIYDKFVAKVVGIAKNRKVGDSFDPTTEQGPQVDKDTFDKVLKYVKYGKEEGATLMIGGERHGKVGYFVQPTIFADVTDDMKIAQDEIFGPVMSIFKFNTFDEVVDRVNDTRYGLASGVLTSNINTALAYAKHVRTGLVWVNTYLESPPQVSFGGFKDSGFGREQGVNGIEQYLETKSIVISLPNKSA